SQAEEDSLDVKDHKLLLFQEVTGLISTWVTSIVEEADWDFERALKLFIQKNADHEIPDLAFAKLGSHMNTVNLSKADKRSLAVARAELVLEQIQQKAN
uniref:Nuclear RNA export factor 2, Panoramix fusion n=1 Tax=Drosophila melanogaster TaxID=7227 RepID=UPI0011329FA4|nr:Chain A, Nuclear RNA export factor 2, Panoramix fusion [Drosophila melanogaster]6OPF_B Chain B, Nuclear RNA export factor 2, Panoramix fusion [Drosophila melanogaster]6OPF_D Chain D, Nuclear RNA export factor 2, Panoramix fusion [Drosophila melanogaster]6OPF_F Chain F, Nuclear RNA export factor 2, Panoramix fusion [Drosophila melanogaster]